MKYIIKNNKLTMGITDAIEFPQETHQADVIVGMSNLQAAMNIVNELGWQGKNDDIRIVVGKDGVLITKSQTKNGGILVCRSPFILKRNDKKK